MVDLEGYLVLFSAQHPDTSSRANAMGPAVSWLQRTKRAWILDLEQVTSKNSFFTPKEASLSYKWCDSRSVLYRQYYPSRHWSLSARAVQDLWLCYNHAECIVRIVCSRFSMCGDTR
jgi:hypothetical protein